MATVRQRTHFLIALIAPFIDSIKRVLVGIVTAEGGGGAVTGSSDAGSAHGHTFTGTAPTVAVAEVVTGTGFATAGQVVTTTDSYTLGLNEWAGMWLQPATQPPVYIASHPAVAAAPVALTVYGQAPTTDAGTFKVLRAPTPAGTNATESSHTHGAGSFETPAASASAVVHHDADERLVTVANATTLLTSIALCKALLVSYAAHRADTLHHQAADATNTVASGVADVEDLATCITAANEIKAAYNAHRGQSGVHWTNDSGHAVTSADATDQSSLNTLLNEIKSDLNAHFAAGISDPPSWRIV